MTNFEELHNLKLLLNRYDISLGDWVEMSHCGFSGAQIYKQSNHKGIPYILKVTSVHTDWIMQTTSDHYCREAILANSAYVHHEQINSPAIGSAQDGAVFSILMYDVSECLLPNERLSENQLNAILHGMNRLHSATPPNEIDVPWCSIEDRLTLLMPKPENMTNFRIANDILRGWEAFFDNSPKNVADLVRSLFDDISPLKRALGQLPNCFLHGDLKIDNIGLCPNGEIHLIDWSMTMFAPAAVELGWFLAMNSRSLPITLDETISAYTSYSNIDRQLHDRHQSLTVLCGLLLRGWRKGLDAILGEPSELLWWCERASKASKIL